MKQKCKHCDGTGMVGSNVRWTNARQLCNFCDGTGSYSSHTLEEQLRASIDRMSAPPPAASLKQQLAEAAGADVALMRPAVEELCAHMELLAKQDRNRTLWFAAVTLAVARLLRESLNE